MPGCDSQVWVLIEGMTTASFDVHALSCESIYRFFFRIGNNDYYSVHVLNQSVCHNNAFICYSDIINQTYVLSFLSCFCSSIDL